MLSTPPLFFTAKMKGSFLFKKIWIRAHKLHMLYSKLYDVQVPGPTRNCWERAPERDRVWFEGQGVKMKERVYLYIQRYGKSSDGYDRNYFCTGTVWPSFLRLEKRSCRSIDTLMKGEFTASSYNIPLKNFCCLAFITSKSSKYVTEIYRSGNITEQKSL